MKHDQTFLLYPGGESGGGNEQKAVPDENQSTGEKIPPTEEDGEHRTVGEKIKEALQDWSNKDQADQDFDDTRV